MKFSLKGMAAFFSLRRDKKRFRNELLELGVRQKDLARLTGKSPLQVNRWLVDRPDAGEIPAYAKMIVYLLRLLPDDVRQKVVAEGLRRAVFGTNSAHTSPSSQTRSACDDGRSEITPQ